MPLTTEDIVQMQQLAARYCHAADSGDGEELQATACYQNAVRRVDGRWLFAEVVSTPI